MSFYPADCDFDQLLLLLYKYRVDPQKIFIRSESRQLGASAISPSGKK